jgi:hypothetical protein
VPATVSVKERNGSGPTDTTVTTATFSASDVAAPGTANPLVKPASGSNYAYWKSLFLNADTTPGVAINNVKWYTDGAIGWTGVVLKAATRATYTQATGTLGTTGNEAGAALSVTMVDASTYVVGAPLALSGSIANPSTGKISDFLILQTVIGTSAVAGSLAAETSTWQWDET